MRYQKTNERRAVILMVVLSLLTLFALVGVTFVLYADAEATAARVAREAQTISVADVNPQEALAYFLGQFIYDVPDVPSTVGSGVRGHSLARTMYGYNYSVPPVGSLNIFPFNGVGRLHYSSPLAYPTNQPTVNNPVTNVPPSWSTQLDDYSVVNYTWFSGDNFVRDPERYGSRSMAQLQALSQPNPYVGGNAPYTYPDLNNFYLAAMKADGTVMVPSFHRPWLFQVGTVNSATKFYNFNDMSNPNWWNQVGKYLTLRPRPQEHPSFPLPGDATGDVKNLTWAPGGNDSIWIDLGAPVMTAPDGTQYKMMFAPLIFDLDNRINLNTAGNILASANFNSTSPSLPHVSNQGWGGWEANLGRVLYGATSAGTATQSTNVITAMASTAGFTPGDYVTVVSGVNALSSVISAVSANSITLANGPPPATWNYPSGPVTVVDQEWTHLFTGRANIPGRYGLNVTTPNTAPSNMIPLFSKADGLATTYPHVYAQADYNAYNETNLGGTPTLRLVPPATAASPFPAFLGSGYGNGAIPNGLAAPNSVVNEDLNHPLLFNAFQTPMNTITGSRAFRASDMEALLRPNSTTFTNGAPVDASASGTFSDLTRLCPFNLGLLAPNMRFRGLVTTQSSDIGAPGVTPYWYSAGGVFAHHYPSVASQALANYNTQCVQNAPVSNALPFPKVPVWTPPQPFPVLPVVGNNPTGVPPNFSEFGLDWRAVSANNATYLPFSANPIYLQFASPPTVPPLGSVYWSWSNPQANQWNLLPNPPPPTPPAPRTQYVTPGGRIRLNQSLPPYPHMGAGLTPPYAAQPGSAPVVPFPTAYGVAFDLRNTQIAGQYQSALNARQGLANDIYRRLLLLTGPNAPFNNPANPAAVSNPPTATQLQDSKNLAVRRWLAQLAVNIVDYIDEDDIVTPFNFYGVADGLAAASLGTTTGGDDTTAPQNGTNQYNNTNQTGANPSYWVFGTEMPKVVLNEVLAEATQPDPTKAAASSESVKVWVELYNTLPKVGGTNTQPQDINRAPLYMTNPAGTGYSPYRITIAETLMNQTPSGATAPTPGSTNYLPDASANVLGQAYFGNANNPNTFSTQLPQSTTDSDFQAGNPNPSTIPLIDGGGKMQGAGVGTGNAGIDAGGYFLIGPPSGSSYPDPFVLASAGNGVPSGTPTYRTANMQYAPNSTTWPAGGNPDERAKGLTVMLRRLANPYMPFNPNPSIADPNIAGNFIPNPTYNPYVTVDYIASVPIQATSSATGAGNSISAFGKRQPYAGLLQLTGNIAAGKIPLEGNSPVTAQTGTVGTNLSNTATNSGTVNNTFGFADSPLPQSGHYDWLVHLDRPPISPMELLHVSAWPPYMLTQRFLIENAYLTAYAGTPTGLGSAPGSDNLGAGGNLANSLNLFAHYAPWLDFPANASTSMAGPWWFDPNPSTSVPPGSTLTAGQTHRLYRLFEFLECGDRGYGVNGMGRIPGKVNINTVWDPEILQALIDANLTTMGLNTMPSQYPPNGTDQIVQIFANMMASRSPSAGYNLATGNLTTNPQTGSYSFTVGPVNMGTPLGAPAVGDDHPFLPLSSGLVSPGGAATQFPNTISVLRDTLLRSNPTAAATNSTLLFQNPTDTQATHPYLQTQLLTKLFNNVTTRSNVFAVFLTVGFFQVFPGGVAGHPNIPLLGPELGRIEGKQIRHRMFSIVDRTNLATFTTSGTANPVGAPTPPAITGPTPNAIWNPAAPAPNTYGIYNPTGTQSVLLANLPAPNNITGTATQLLVPNLTTGIQGVIQAGTQLVIDAGTVNEETVTVLSVTAPVPPTVPASFTANFTLPHGIGGTSFSISQRGNPGPWLLIPYDPRLDPNVVLYFSIIN